MTYIKTLFFIFIATFLNHNFAYSYSDECCNENSELSTTLPKDLADFVYNGKKMKNINLKDGINTYVEQLPKKEHWGISAKYGMRDYGYQLDRFNQKSIFDKNGNIDLNSISQNLIIIFKHDL